LYSLHSFVLGCTRLYSFVLWILWILWMF
jgi:hypothetical protein